MYEKAQEIPGADLQFYKDKTGSFFGIKYGDFSELMLDFAAGLYSFGAKAGEHIGLISDNRREWLTCSMGIMALGCADIPRGSEATVKDLAYILRFAGCRIVIVESNYSLKKILECRAELSALERVIMIDPAGRETGGAKIEEIALFSYDEIVNEGKDFRKSNPGEVETILDSGKADDTATIIFTSGTTGVPKGVELTHANFISQLESIASMLPLKTGDKALCVLPVWHIYEREMEYYFIYAGISLCYSRPVASMIMADMKKIRPQFMACVPRIWEAIYKALQKQIKSESMGKWMLFGTLSAAAVTIRKLHDIIFARTLRFKRSLVTLQILNKVLYIPIFFLIPLKVLGEILFFNTAREILGGHFKIGTSGGGGLAPKLDRFFNSIGIRVVEVYGLTETAPFCCIRNFRHPVLGTIGKVLPFCEARVIDKNGAECKAGQLGVLYIKGPNVMKGYYKRPELTADVLKDGWFNTGDLVIQSYRGEIVVKGRQKDTIVLRSGENVEPFPIECKLEESEYIAKAVVVGQDKKSLGALIVPAKDAIKEYAEHIGLETSNMATVLKSEPIRALIFKEMERLITVRNGFKPFEKVGKFVFLDKQFEVGVELSAKGGIMRQKIEELYKWQIVMLFSENAVVQNLGAMLPPNLPNIGTMISTNMPSLESIKSKLQAGKKDE